MFFHPYKVEAQPELLQPRQLVDDFQSLHHSLWVCRLFEELNSSGFQPDKVHFVEMRGFFKNGVDVSIAYKIFATRVHERIPAAKDSVRFLKPTRDRVTYTEPDLSERHRYGE